MSCRRRGLGLIDSRRGAKLRPSTDVMGGKSKGGGKKGKANAQTRGKAPGGRVYEVAQAILNAPPGGVASVIRAALEDRDAPLVIENQPEPLPTLLRFRINVKEAKSPIQVDALLAPPAEYLHISFRTGRIWCNRVQLLRAPG